MTFFEEKSKQFVHTYWRKWGPVERSHDSFLLNLLCRVACRFERYYIYIYRHGLFGEFSFSLTTKKWKHTTMNERLKKNSNLVWSMHFYSICFVFSKLQIFIFFLEFKNFEMFCWVCKIIGNGWYHVPSWQAVYADQKNFGVFNQLCMKGRTVARMSVATVVWH